LLHLPPAPSIALAPRHAVSAMARQLTALHEELTALLAGLEAETARATPDMAALTRHRFRLAQASRKRSALLDTLLAERARVAAPHDLVPLLALQKSVREARAISTEHIACWTAQAVEDDWAGYRADSRRQRQLMRQQIAREAKFLLLI
jgi:hypothetical protein